MKRVSTIRELTEEERREVKKQRRLIKNREYAQASRKKRKATAGQVNEKYSAMETENETLKKRVLELEARVNSLEGENYRLRKAMITPKVEDSMMTSEEVFFDEEEINSVKKSHFIANTVFFVVLFSFGLFFNFGLYSDSILPGASQTMHIGRTVFAATVKEASIASFSASPLLSTLLTIFDSPTVSEINTTIATAVVNATQACI